MSKMKVTIRLAQRSDLDKIVKLWVQLMELTAEVSPRYRLRSGAEDTQRAVIADLIVRDDAFVMVCEVGSRLIAFSDGYLTHPAKTFAQSTLGIIENLFVIEPWRRRGIGREMVRRASAWLTHYGATEFHVNVVPKNVDSLKFWRAMEFEVHRVAMFKPAAPK